MKKLTALVSMVIIMCSTVHAKQIKPAEIMGRDLDTPGLGWAGHVGIATAEINSAAGLSQNATLVAEILNETPVGQFNSIDNFKSRSPYWGSKYGVADNSDRAFRVLVEASKQIWLCPRYTSDTDYVIGKGNLKTGEVYECSRWRCDTFAWYAFFSQGWNTMPGQYWLPKILFNAFPYFNDEKFASKTNSTIYKFSNRTLDEVTAEELNVMPFEEFEMIMGQPPVHPIPTQAESAEVRFSYDENINDVKRGIMIDRLVTRGNEPDLIPKLLKLYNQSKRAEVKDKVIENLMIYNQHYRNDVNYSQADRLLVGSFFAELLNSKVLTSRGADATVRGFIDTHSPEEIMDKRKIIDALLLATDHYSSVMLKYSLVHKSKELQLIYIKSIVNELREAKDSYLDSYFFGPLDIGYQGTGKNLLLPESKQVVIDYLSEVSYKYSPKGIKSNPGDFHASFTAPFYFKLRENVGLKR